MSSGWRLAITFDGPLRTHRSFSGRKGKGLNRDSPSPDVLEKEMY
jgi:hypothetical protein